MQIHRRRDIMFFLRKGIIMASLLLLTASWAVPGFCEKGEDAFNVYEYDKIFRTKFITAFPELAKEILDYAKMSEGVCIDIGCGPGYLSFAIAEVSRFQIHSLDISPQAIELTKKYVTEKNLAGRVFPVVGDVHKMPYSDRFADLVVSRGSLPFGTDKTQAFREIKRVLKPGGIAYIGCGFGAGYKKIVEDRQPRDRNPPKKFTHDSILKSLEDAGITDYTVIDDYHRGYWVIIRN
jgi:SAM-dependent methyltransferase